MKATLVLLSLAAFVAPVGAGNWIPLFNGRDLDGWTPKFANHQVGENPNDIFRVEDGLLKVSYEDAGGKFDGNFGHLFHKTPYSHYRIRAEFRFTGEQAGGGPGWAYRNNGLMLHSQAPETMAMDRNFPDSIECQFWGNHPDKGEKFSNRPMANLFTPGTKVTLDGKESEGGGDTSSSEKFSGLDWVTVEVEVRGDEFIHFVNGKEVLRYSKTRLDDGTPLTSGYIAIQAETHPTEFRRIELLPLEGNQCVPNGMTSLFDGRTLDGWKVHPKSVGHWTVIDGVIDYDAKSEAPKLDDKHLWTAKSFGDFELHVDWRIKETHGLYPVSEILPDGSFRTDAEGRTITTPTPNADSGILLRGELDSQCNIWCWPAGSGEVWGYRMNRKMPPEVRAGVVPKVRADNPVGEWNRFIIRMQGDRLTVNLNGRIVIENAQLPGIPPTGPIGFQHHGEIAPDGSYGNAASLVQFRNVFIKAL
jgi:hypothetical protein